LKAVTAVNEPVYVNVEIKESQRTQCEPVGFTFSSEDTCPALTTSESTTSDDGTKSDSDDSKSTSDDSSSSSTSGGSSSGGSSSGGTRTDGDGTFDCCTRASVSAINSNPIVFKVRAKHDEMTQTVVKSTDAVQSFFTPSDRQRCGTIVYSITGKNGSRDATYQDSLITLSGEYIEIDQEYY
jgi:hypothetical protein